MYAYMYLCLHASCIVMQEHKRILEKALHDSQLALAIAEECIIQREKRTGIEQVHDEAEKGLCKVYWLHIHRLLAKL